MIQPEKTTTSRALTSLVFLLNLSDFPTLIRSLRFSPALRHHEYDENNHKLEEINFTRKVFNVFLYLHEKLFSLHFNAEIY